MTGRSTVNTDPILCVTPLTLWIREKLMSDFISFDWIKPYTVSIIPLFISTNLRDNDGDEVVFFTGI